MDIQIIGNRPTANSSLNGFGISASTSSSAAKPIFASQSDTPQQKVIRKQFSRSRERLGLSRGSTDALGRLMSNDKQNNFTAAESLSYYNVHSNYYGQDIPGNNPLEGSEQNYKIQSSNNNNNNYNSNSFQDKDVLTLNLNYSSSQQCFDPSQGRITTSNNANILNHTDFCLPSEFQQQDSISLAYNRNIQPLSDLINSNQTNINSNQSNNFANNTINISKNLIQNSRMPPTHSRVMSMNRLSHDAAYIKSQVTNNPDQIAQRLSTTVTPNINDQQHGKLKRANSIILNHSKINSSFPKVPMNLPISISATCKAGNSTSFFSGNGAGQIQNRSDIRNDDYKMQFQKQIDLAQRNDNTSDDHLNTCPGYTEFTNSDSDHIQQNNIIHNGDFDKTEVTYQQYYQQADNDQNQENQRKTTNYKHETLHGQCSCQKDIAELSLMLSEMRQNTGFFEKKQIQLEEENQLLWRRIRQLEQQLEDSYAFSNKENTNGQAAMDLKQQEKAIRSSNNKLKKQNAEMEELIKQVLLQKELAKQREHKKTKMNSSCNQNISQFSDNSQVLKLSQESQFFTGGSYLLSPNVSKVTAGTSEPKPQRPRNNSEEKVCHPGLLKKEADEINRKEGIQNSDDINMNRNSAEDDGEEQHQYFFSVKDALGGVMSNSSGQTYLSEKKRQEKGNLQQTNLDMKERLILSKIHEVPSFANYQSN